MGRDPERALWGRDRGAVTWRPRRIHPREEGSKQWNSICKGPVAGQAGQEQQEANARWRLGDVGEEGKVGP